MFSVLVGAFSFLFLFPSFLSNLGRRGGQESLIIGSLPRLDALRYRCHSILSLQRVMAHLHSQAASSMPADAQLQLLAVLQVYTVSSWRACLVPVSFCHSIPRLFAWHVIRQLHCSCSCSCMATTSAPLPSSTVAPACMLWMQDIDYR